MMQFASEFALFSVPSASGFKMSVYDCEGKLLGSIVEDFLSVMVAQYGFSNWYTMYDANHQQTGRASSNVITGTLVVTPSNSNITQGKAKWTWMAVDIFTPDTPGIDIMQYTPGTAASPEFMITLTAMGYLRMVGASLGSVAYDGCSRFIIVCVPLLVLFWILSCICGFFMFRNKCVGMLFSLIIPFLLATLVAGLMVGVVVAFILMFVKNILGCCKGNKELVKKIDIIIVCRWVLNVFSKCFTWSAHSANNSKTCNSLCPCCVAKNFDDNPHGFRGNKIAVEQ